MRAGGRDCENGSVSDAWLEHGHGIDGSDLMPVFSSSSVPADGAGAPSRSSWTSGWRAVVVGGALALLATLGVVGVANAISDNLFPSMGSTSPASVWQNPVPPAEQAPTTVVVPSTAPTVPTMEPTMEPTTVPTTVPTTSSLTTAPTVSPTTTPSSKAVVSPSSSVATSVSPTTSTPDQTDDDDRVDDGPVDDDLLDDDSGGSGGSGSDDSDSSGRSGSDDSGSDRSDDD
jgi:hypothetical protein